MYNVALFISFVTLGKAINLSDPPISSSWEIGACNICSSCLPGLWDHAVSGECPDPEGRPFLIPSPIALPLCFLILFSSLLQERHFRALADLTMPVAATNSESGKKGLWMSVCICGSGSARQGLEGGKRQPSGTLAATCKNNPSPTAAPSCHSAFPSGSFYGPHCTCSRVGPETQLNSSPWRAEACTLQR